MLQTTKENISLVPGNIIDSLTLTTGVVEVDLSVTAKIELQASEEIIKKIRETLRRSGRSSVSYHAVEGTLQGKLLVETLLKKLTDLSDVKFPESWDMDVEIQERWPRQKNIAILDLNGGQDADGVATLLCTVGIEHDYHR